MSELIKATWVPNDFPDMIAAITGTEATQTGYYEIKSEPWYITIEPRPAYCDRGRWIAKISGPDIDGNDGWPRYYFDLERCMQEIQSWIEFRKAKENERVPDRVVG